MKPLDQTLMDQRVQQLEDEIEQLREQMRSRLAKTLISSVVVEEKLRAELAEAQAVIEQMHKFAFDRHDAMLDQIVDDIMKGDTALKRRLAQERERCAQLCDKVPEGMWSDDADYDTGLLHGFRMCATKIRALGETK